ncbi:hypothetical protein GCM10027052_10520 [Parafrigoribacterium mesophilum]|uniref:hypothetical protein n=1 Tax=Parafrigoribacterium mesophilum TaxID=433646 RepID=UPI0031FE15CC
MSIDDDLQSHFAKWSSLASDESDESDDDLVRSLRLYSGESNRDAFNALGVRQRNWLANVRALHQFVDSRGRLPHRTWRGRKDSADAAEEHLVNWLREQRRHSQSLCTYQRDRLEAIPGFEWSPKEEAWDRKVDDYRAFVIEHDRRPSLSSGSRAEQQLAVWERNQRMAQRDGRLPKHRVDEAGALPGWRWSTE